MTDVPVLWSSGARKEVTDLLRRVWTDGDPATRNALSDLLVEGPPGHLLERIDEDRRTDSRDRRIFDRISVLDRLEEPPLTDALRAEAARIRRDHPEWRAAEGERADFSTWMEFRVGPDTPFSLEELAAASIEELAVTLSGTEDQREGLLEIWRDLAGQDAQKALNVLIAVPLDPAVIDIWVYGLWGIRDQARTPEVRERVLGLIFELPEAFLRHEAFARATADVLEVAAKLRPAPMPDRAFWHAFDRVLAAASEDRSNAEGPEGSGWVGLAINTSMGSLASAFFDAMFGRGLKAGEGVPEDLRDRLARLLSLRAETHRPARVIAASRLSYLYAVDPDWTRARLLPLFDWRDEVEALAVWQGFAWQPRIDERLWADLKPYFLPMFTPERLAAMGASGSQMAAMLMLVGVEFGYDQLPRDSARNAIRAMPERLRTEAAAWIATYLREHARPQGDSADEISVDEAWTKRVSPWLTRVWPPEPDPASRGVAAQFARAITAVDEAFPEALNTLSPYLLRGSSDIVIHELDTSNHPERHPSETLALLDQVIDAEQIWMADDLRAVLDRIREAAPDLEATHEYRRLNDRLRAAER